MGTLRLRYRYRKIRRSGRRIQQVARRTRRFVYKSPVATSMIVAGIVVLSGVMMYKNPHPTIVNQDAYNPLLNTIAKGESNGDYNAYYGNTSGASIRFTNMTVEQVLQWQDEHVRQGSLSSAVGKYQIVRPTLSGLIRQLKLDPQTTYNEATQDRLAITLLERRGSLAYAKNKLSREQFAANLAQEWAALPKVIGDNPQKSYYAGDGLNQSRVSIDEVFTALGTFRNSAVIK